MASPYSSQGSMELYDRRPHDVPHHGLLTRLSRRSRRNHEGDGVAYALHQGPLDKKLQNRHWKRRYVVLRDQALREYAIRDDGKPDLTFPLDQVPVTDISITVNPLKHKFIVSQNAKSRHESAYRASTAEELDEWLTALSLSGEETSHSPSVKYRGARRAKLQKMTNDLISKIKASTGSPSIRAPPPTSDEQLQMRLDVLRKSISEHHSVIPELLNRVGEFSKQGKEAVYTTVEDVLDRVTSISDAVAEIVDEEDPLCDVDEETSVRLESCQGGLCEALAMICKVCDGLIAGGELQKAPLSELDVISSNIGLARNSLTTLREIVDSLTPTDEQRRFSTESGLSDSQSLQSPASGVSDDPDLLRLVEMGFDERSARSALFKHGSVDKAANSLIESDAFSSPVEPPPRQRSLTASAYRLQRSEQARSQIALKPRTSSMPLRRVSSVGALQGNGEPSPSGRVSSNSVGARSPAEVDSPVVRDGDRGYVITQFEEGDDEDDDDDDGGGRGAGGDVSDSGSAHRAQDVMSSQHEAANGSQRHADSTSKPKAPPSTQPEPSSNPGQESETDSYQARPKPGSPFMQRRRMSNRRSQVVQSANRETLYLVSAQPSSSSAGALPWPGEDRYMSSKPRSASARVPPFASRNPFASDASTPSAAGSRRVSFASSASVWDRHELFPEQLPSQSYVLNYKLPSSDSPEGSSYGSPFARRKARASTIPEHDSDGEAERALALLHDEEDDGDENRTSSRASRRGSSSSSPEPGDTAVSPFHSTNPFSKSTSGPAGEASSQTAGDQPQSSQAEVARRRSAVAKRRVLSSPPLVSGRSWDPASDPDRLDRSSPVMSVPNTSPTGRRKAMSAPRLEDPFFSSTDSENKRSSTITDDPSSGIHRSGTVVADNADGDETVRHDSNPFAALVAAKRLRERLSGSEADMAGRSASSTRASRTDVTNQVRGLRLAGADDDVGESSTDVDHSAATSNQDPRAAAMEDIKQYFGTDVEVDDQGMVLRIEHVSGRRIKRVQAATVTQAVDFLVSDENHDPCLLSSFVICYRLFSDTQTLLQLLLDKHIRLQADMEAHSQDAAPGQIRQHQRVVAALCELVQPFYSDLRETDVGQLFTVAHDCLRLGYLDLSRAIRSKLHACRRGGDRGKRKQSSAAILPAPISPILTSSIPEHPSSPGRVADFVDASSLELARQLCVLDCELFQTISSEELLSWMSPRKRSQCESINNMVSHFNRVSGWVATTIVRTQGLRKRARVLNKFVSIMKHLRRLYNFNSLLAVLSGINSAAVHRLKHTFEVAGSKTQGTIAKLNELMSHERSFAVYRAACRACEPPVMPYLGLYLTDLTFLDLGNPDTLLSPVDPSVELVNFVKFQQLHNICKAVKHFQAMPYDFERHPEAQAVFNNFQHEDEDTLYDISLDIEPRDSHIDDVAQ